MSSAIRCAVAVLLQDAKVQYVAALRERGAKQPALSKDERPWEHDVWSCTFSRQGRDALQVTFRTGVGHRAHPRGWLGPDRTLRPGTLAWEAQEARKTPTPPNAADVLHSLVADDPRGEDFESWCGNYGYEADSRKALATYLECQEQTSRCARFFDRDLWSSVQSAVENY